MGGWPCLLGPGDPCSQLVSSPTASRHPPGSTWSDGPRALSPLLPRGLALPLPTPSRCPRLGGSAGPRCFLPHLSHLSVPPSPVLLPLGGEAPPSQTWPRRPAGWWSMPGSGPDLWPDWRAGLSLLGLQKMRLSPVCKSPAYGRASFFLACLRQLIKASRSCSPTPSPWCWPSGLGGWRGSGWS